MEEMERFGDRMFYHIYPLGFCGAPRRNDFSQAAGSGLRAIAGHVDHLARLGVTAVYLGPLFESISHGYDTVDYFHVDRRLGNNADLAALINTFHERGIVVILDAVFNHTGREFFAFKDLKERRHASPYTDWYVGLDFSRNNHSRDGFVYETWGGHESLPKLNLDAPAVREHLFAAVERWIDEFDIDGLRLDAVNVMSVDFLQDLSTRRKAVNPGFFLVGETVAGDYRDLAREGRLDSVTNYELYKSLWSSLNDRNFFELAWTLRRQSGPDGLYRGLELYNFVENHDVNRAASVLRRRAHLFPLYGLLFCAPGIPSLYYGGEYGVTGTRDAYTDHALRPAWNDAWARDGADLARAVADFARIRRGSPALRHGAYREAVVRSEQFAFVREYDDRRGGDDRGRDGAADTVLVAVNASECPAELTVPPETLCSNPSSWRDLLSGDRFTADPRSGLRLPLYPSWLRILRREERRNSPA